MSTAQAATVVTGVDFVSVPTRTWNAPWPSTARRWACTRSVYRPERNFAEFETGTVTLSVVEPRAHGHRLVLSPTPTTSRCTWRTSPRRARRWRSAASAFAGDTLDTTVCHMAIFADPDGNALMLHHRYAPRVTEGQ